MRRYFPSSFTVLLFTLVGVTIVWSSNARYRPTLTIAFNPYSAVDTGNLKYPLTPSDNVLDDNLGGIKIKDSPNVERKVDYNPDTRMYTITETIGGRFFKSPQYLSFEEFQKYELTRVKSDYWRQRSGATNLIGATSIIPKLYVENQAFDRVFGGGSVDIRPQGSFQLTFQGQFNKNENPLANERSRSNGTFDFDEQIQLNVVGNIGDKLKITTNYNTESQFDFENQVKLDYTGYEDEIIKKIEAGNVSLPLSSSLISGSQSLFGIKTQLQFGRLTVTSVLSQQKSEQKEITINSGSQSTDFRLQGDNYEANKHYFLAHYFRDNYNKALANLPVVNSRVNINKVEVWITNKTNSNTDSRDIIGFIDFGENEKIFNVAGVAGGPGYNPLPNTDETTGNTPSNDLLRKLPAAIRKSDDNTINNYFPNPGGNDNFNKLTFARKLTDREFTFNPQLGYLSLNQSLNSDEVLCVAYRYTVDGVEYQVGEFSSDRPNNQENPEVLYTKLLKNETIKVRLPTWDLMMKNIYNIGGYQISPQGFKLDIFRLDEATSVEKQVMAEGVNTTGKIFLQLFNLDNLNIRQENKPDGIFDFIEGITIDPQNGRIVIPLVEPFGTDFREKFASGETALIKKYVFQQLYDTTKYSAQQFPELNRYFIKGTYQGSSSSEFSLNAINVPQGSVVVTAGTQKLQEGIDYTVDYNIGRVKIVNEGILNSGQQIKIRLESNQLFAVQSKTFLGTRFDYRVNKKLNAGATVVRLSERPLTQKVNIGDEPIKNTMYGFDVNYNTDSRLLTRLVDRIPLINTKVKSSVTVSGEFAQLVPGHSQALNTASNKKGISYIDDFEGSKSVIDLRNSTAWFISGTPQLFTSAQLTNNLDYGFERARLAFYNIDPLFYSKTNSATPSHIKSDKAQLSNHYVRQVIEQEVFPSKPVIGGSPNTLQTFDLYYNPNIRGPYNFTATGLNADGRLNNPQGKWGGITRRLESNDFEALNVEFIEFWLLDPFIYNPMAAGGDLYFNLGNISEDILKDGRKSLENGLPADGDLGKVDTTVWGRVPRLQAVTQAFDNNPDSRRQQDVGLDGLSTADEVGFFENDYLAKVRALHGDNSPAYQQAVADPSADDFHYYRGGDLDNAKSPIIERYARYNGTESNSKTAEQSLAQTGLETTAATPNPDGEDYNRDNNSSKSDEYFQYRIAIVPDSFVVGKNFITDRVNATVTLEDKSQKTVTWYQFKVPISQAQERVGDIQDFKSIRFMRMFLTGFVDSTVLRFARLQLGRGDWRRNDPLLSRITLGDSTITGTDNSLFDLSTVNVEENARRTPVPYVLPPGIQQERNQQDVRGATFQNEQSLALNVCNLQDGFARAAFKNVTLDFRSYKRLEMFIHAEGANLQNGDVTGFIRIGSDYNDNYYEYEIPMQITPDATTNPDIIWPLANKLDISFSVLQQAKQLRNSLGVLINQVFSVADGGNKIYVKGQPDLSKVRVIMLGVRNPKNDGFDKCTQLWFNELRMSEFDEDGGWAAIGRVNAQLADFANVTVSGAKSTYGFGSIDKKVSERQRTENTQFDASSSVELGKFLPEKSGIKIPMFVNYSKAVSKPQFAPDSPDILLENVEKQKSKTELDSLNDVTERKGINFTNVRKEKTSGGPARIYDISNLSATYAYTQSSRRNYLTSYDSTKTYKAALSYNYNSQPKNYRPLEKVIKSPSLRLLKDFNFNLRPYALDFRIDGDRIYNVNKLRDLDTLDNIGTRENFNKNFKITRVYGLKWDLAKSLKFDFTATNQSLVEEPEGRITALNRDTLTRNLKRLGRTTNYGHTASLGYTVPINKLPFFDWTNLIARYAVKYDWKIDPLFARQGGFPTGDTTIGGKDSLSAISFGNTISNSRTITINPTFTLTTLYNKSKYLRGLNTPKKPTNKGPAGIKNLQKDLKAKLDTAKGKEKPKAEEEEKPDRLAQTGRFFARLLVSLKTINGTYSLTNGTTIPGYLGKTTYLGLDGDRGNAPGYNFAFGSQRNIIDDLASDNLITRDRRQNNQYLTNKKEDINIRANFEPLPDLRVEFTGNRTISFTNQAFYRIDSNQSSNTFNKFISVNPVTTGSFSISFFSLRTAFSSSSVEKPESKVFDRFSENRAIISERLAAENPKSNPANDSAGYKDGYGRYQQDVLIPAFLAAYSGTSVNGQSLNYLTKIPAPNYRVTFTGLTRIPAIAEIFSNVSVTHSYKSTYSLNSFTTLVRYEADKEGNVISRDFSNNFLPRYQAQQASISEQFAPLLGFDMRLKNNVSVNIEYRKTRNLGLSLSNGQLSEQRDNQITLGTGYRTSNIKFPIKLKGDKQLVLKNDINFKFDVSIGDTRSIVHRLDVVNGSDIAAGQYTITFRPSADYVINERFNIRIFYDRRVVKPYTSLSFKVANTNVGVSLRFTLGS